MLEKTFQKKVLAKIRAIPGNPWVTKLNDATTIGLPDIILMVAGIGFAIELKTNSKLSEIQFVTLNRMERAGFTTFVVTPENWDEIYKYICAHASGHPDRFKKPAKWPEWVLPASQRRR